MCSHSLVHMNPFPVLPSLGKRAAVAGDFGGRDGPCTSIAPAVTRGVKHTAPADEHGDGGERLPRCRECALVP